MDTTLIIMAAGIGSRFGTGIKQLAKMAPNGEIIMDYSIHDAIEAGFDKIVFIIRRDIEEAFREVKKAAEAMMKEAYMMGVDQAYVFTDRTFAGADVLATSYTLAQGITSICDYDMIICGKQTTDGDTAQVGPAMAEYLGIPCAAWVGEITDVDEDFVTVGQDFVNVRQLAKMKLPCLITVEKDIYTPRLPSYRLKAATKDRKVEMITFADFKDQDVTHYGLKGSATSVERIFPPESHDGQIFMKGSAEQTAGELADIFAERKYI